MPITLITGPANAGKAQVLMDTMRRHLAHGEDPLLIVPTRADADLYLRELAGEGVAMGVRVERFAGLIGELVRRSGVDRPLLSGVARERMLEVLAARAGAPTSAGFVRALGELFAELRVRRATPARLSRALSDWRALDGRDDHPRAHQPDLERLYADYCTTLERLGRVDGEQRAMRALDALRRQPALWGGTPVLVYGFDDLTALQLDAIESLGGVLDAPVTVSLAYEPGRIAFAGRAASFHALAPLASEHRRLRARAEYYAPPARTALSHLERSLFESDTAGVGREEPVGRVGADQAVRLLEGGGERGELELIAGEILVLLGEGIAPEEIAVLARPGGVDLDLLREVFSAAGIPFALHRRTPFSDTVVGRALVGLLRCVPEPERSHSDGPRQVDGPRRPDGRGQAGELEDLLAWLRAPGLLERAELADWLELRARRTGVADAARARALWEERHWPLRAIDRLHDAQARGPTALCERAARELHWLFCAPRRASAAVLAPDELEQAGALTAGRRALAELRELARIAPELAPATAGELARTLARLEQSGGQVAAEPSGGRVAVLDPLALRARRVRALFVCGLQEGVFPARSRPQALFTEDERRSLAEVSGLRLGDPAQRSPAGQLAAERYLLYAAVSRPRERLFLSWHAADDDGQASPRSLFVDDVCDLFDESLWHERAIRVLGAVSLPLRGRCDGLEPTCSLADQDPSPRGQPQAGVTIAGTLRDERVLASLRARVWSASSLERWIGCPVSWFVDRMLHPDTIDPDPEPLARGGLAHAALKDTLEGLRRETGRARLTPAVLGQARELLAGALADNEARHPLSVAPERRIAVRRRLQADLERYLEHAAVADSPLEPSELELAFGFDAHDASSPEGEGEGERGQDGRTERLPALDLGGGVKLRGRIDRVDVGEHGDAVVYDYKGARAPASARWIKDGQLQVALYMRAVEELLHVQAVGGFYQPLAGEDLRPRGVLDADAQLELDCVSSDVREHAQVRELLEQALAAAREVAAEAGRGELQARPQTCAFRGGCMYPAICRCGHGTR